MTWRIVCRSKPRQAVESMLATGRVGPLVVTGEPRIGRSNVLMQLVDLLDAVVDVVIIVDVHGDRLTPAALTAHRHDAVVVPAVVDAIRQAAAQAPGSSDPGRVAFVVDDAHLASHAAVQALRDLHRRTGAMLLLSRPTGIPIRKPDPLDCLRYESGLRYLPVAPFDINQVQAVFEEAVGGPARRSAVAALHAATGGNPGLLHELLITSGLAAELVHSDGAWQLPDLLTRRLELSERCRSRLLAALDDAWTSMSLERLGDLGRLAMAAGAVEQAAPSLAFALLLDGQVDEGVRLLGRVRLESDDESGVALAALTQALLLAFGADAVDQAALLLADAAAAATSTRHRLLAGRAWLLATTGHTNLAVVALDGVDPTVDAHAAVFGRATAAAVDLEAGRAKAAVSHLRRAIIAGETIRAELPWLLPYLTGELIDALLLAGRVNEATAAAADFHAERAGSGWDITVALSALLRSTSVGASVGAPVTVGGRLGEPSR
jgi:hypothetical protein